MNNLHFFSNNTTKHLQPKRVSRFRLAVLQVWPVLHLEEENFLDYLFIFLICVQVFVYCTMQVITGNVGCSGFVSPFLFSNLCLFRMKLCEGLNHLSSFITMLLTNYHKVFHFTYSYYTYCKHTSLYISSMLKISGLTYKRVKAERNTDWHMRQASTLQNTPHKIMWNGISFLRL